MEIARDYYLQQLIDRQWNGLVKVITGIRRCGKSYLLRNLFKKYLLSHGVAEAQIIHTGFRQMEMPHIMENIVCNELLARNFSVDVGIVYENVKNKNGNYVRKQREIDFVATKGNRKYYVQSASAMTDEEKQAAELKPFSLTRDSFPKIIVRNDVGKSWYNEEGVLNVGLTEFLLDRSIVD